MSSLQEFYYTRPRNAALLIGAGLAVAGVAIGALLGFTGPIITLAVVVALAGGLLALRSLELGLWGVVGVICLLPFATLPIKIVITPTFLNLVMGAMLGVYVLQWMTLRRRKLAATPAHPLIVVYAVFAVFAFVVGMDNGPLTSTIARRFAEFVLTIGFGLVIVDVVQDEGQLEWLTRIILLAGLGAAVIGIGLWLLPDDLANRVLNLLVPLGYPGGDVLRYIEDNPELGERAIGTSVDPNSYGGLLTMMGALAAPQLVAKKPLFGNVWIARGMFGVIVLALLLTQSRAAMAGLVAAMGLIAVLRYRSLLVWMGVGGLLILVLPVTQDYVARFVAGFQGADLATQMRFGEYKDAFILLSRYPVFGVGFLGTPDIDIYLGVSNAYLALAQKMGYVGLAVFLAALAGVFAYGLVNRTAVYAQERLSPLWLGWYAGLAGILVVGIFDHYFVNVDFQPAQTIFWLFVGLALATTRMAVMTNDK